ncbi:MAG: UvrD-helicase domain-containing protein [Desulfovibrio sp.]|jgi:ATP-dependent exoDNAse (exonuclease V) beta subunit|nr:UvrD-helicase domain-containing protein [Desulfovibrio sp.]
MRFDMRPASVLLKRTVTRLTQIKASAGSGKTFELTARFLRLLAKSDPGGGSRAACLSLDESSPGLGDILAVTFTNAAALEMRGRVIRRLKLAALGRSGDIARDMPAETAHVWVNKIVRDLSALNIRTIDSLVHLIVRAAALDLALPPDFAPVFSSEDALLPYLDTLIERAAQKDAPMRALLGAACGALAAQSTSGGFLAGERLLRRLRALFDAALRGDYDDLSPRDEIVKLRDSLLEDVATAARGMLAVAAEHRLPWRTAALAAMRKAANGEADGASRCPRKDDAEELFLKNTVLPAMAGAAFANLVKARDNWMLHGPALEEALKLFPFVELARTLARAFMRNLENEGNLPALLVPAFAQTALHRENGVPDALCRLGSRLRHFLLDEFQDTSREQWQTLKPLVEDALSRGGTLTCVGDVKQSIYGWRGGEPELFDAVFEDDALNRLAPGMTRDVLPFNWRSGPVITAHNNSFFSPLQQPETALEVMKALLPQDTPPDILRGSARKVQQAFDGCGQRTPEGRRGGFVRAEALEADSTRELTELVLTRLCGLLRQDISRRRKLADVLVLTRSNNQAAAVAERLTLDGLPVVTENSLLLAAHPLIVQTVALLSFLDNPNDDIAFWTVLTGSIVREHPKAGNLSWNEAHNLLSAGFPLHKHFRTGVHPVWETLFAPFSAQSGLMTPYDIVQEWFARLDVEARFPGARTFLRRFMEVLYSAEEKGLGDTASFLAFWQETGGEEKVPMPENMDAVRVMTIHKSKGLEAPVVILPWTGFTVRNDSAPVLLETAGLHLAAPAHKNLGQIYYARCARQARENLHLLYVALTRAREELHIFRTGVGPRKNMPSLCKGMDILWEATGLELPYTCGEPPEYPESRQPEACAPPSPHPAPRAFPDDWRPLDWLPRLKIFRTPLDRLPPEATLSRFSAGPDAG